MLLLKAKCSVAKSCCSNLGIHSCLNGYITVMSHCCRQHTEGWAICNLEMPEQHKDQMLETSSASAETTRLRALNLAGHLPPRLLPSASGVCRCAEG